MKDEHLKDAAQDVAEDVPPPRHATAAAAAVFVQLALRCECNWAAQWHLARPVGKRFQGSHAKRFYVDNLL